MNTPTLRLALPLACVVGVLLCGGCSGLQTPALLPPAQPQDEGYGWQPDPAVIGRAAALYDGPDPAQQEAAYNQAYAELYHSTPDNAVADWQIAKRANALYDGPDPKRKKVAYLRAYYETWHRYPPADRPIPDTHLWIDPASPAEQEQAESGLGRPSRSSKIGTK